MLLALVGCGKARAPECGDEMTLDLVRSIIQRELGAASAAANLSEEQLRSVLPISLAHPTSFDEKDAGKVQEQIVAGHPNLTHDQPPGAGMATVPAPKLGR